MTTTHEREILAPVELCTPRGRLHQDAVGWSRRPLHRANLRGWGRAKRWEYWCVQGPDHVLAVTVSSIDYLALHTVWFLSFATPNRAALDVEQTAIVPLGRVDLPDRSGGGPVHAAARGLAIDIRPSADVVAISARTDRVVAGITLQRPTGHESLGVVIPWNERRFQYTVKENTLPATGTVTVDGHDYTFEPADSYGVLDHGRGKWPYATRWNWGSGSGPSDGHLVGLQFGGKWTDGTGMTENALCLDGRLHKIGDDLRWDYDPTDWLAPWRVRTDSGRVDLTFTPRYERMAKTQAVLVATEVHQCFGTWWGSVLTDDDQAVAVTDVRGFAEEARMRW